MKQLISILIVVVVLATLALTCPDKESHLEAINNELITVIDQKMYESSSPKDDDDKNAIENGLKIMTSSLLGGFTKGIIEQQLMVKNYVLVSIGQVNGFEGRKTLSVGICNHVFTLFSSEDLLEQMKESAE